MLFRAEPGEQKSTPLFQRMVDQVGDLVDGLTRSIDGLNQTDSRLAVPVHDRITHDAGLRKADPRR